MKAKEKCREIQRMLRERIYDVEVRVYQEALLRTDYSLEELRAMLKVWQRREVAVEASDTLEAISAALEYQSGLEHDSEVALFDSTPDELRALKVKQRGILDAALEDVVEAEAAIPSRTAESEPVTEDPPAESSGALN